MVSDGAETDVEASFDWTSYTSSTFDVSMVDCTHEQMLEEEWAREIAVALTRLWDG